MIGLANLTAYSLTEDAYGVVQRDLPRVLEALLSFLTALEAYALELEKEASNNHTSTSSTDEMSRYLYTRKQKESDAIGELIGPLLTGTQLLACLILSLTPRYTALRGGIKLIAGAFGGRLESFRFPPATAEQLQAIVDG